MIWGACMEAEPDLPSAVCSWINTFVVTTFPINQSELRDTVYVKFRLTTRFRCFYIIISLRF